MDADWKYRAVLTVTTLDGLEVRANVQSLTLIGNADVTMLALACNEAIARKRAEADAGNPAP